MNAVAPIILPPLHTSFIVPQRPGWAGLERVQDGLIVRLPPAMRSWMVLPTDDRYPMLLCRGCGQTMSAPLAAMEAADNFCPPLA